MPDYTEHQWIVEFPGAATVCDAEGIILEMNERAVETLAEDGGRALLGTNALDCHPAEARRLFEHLLETHQANIYTIEKNGVKKLIYQAPWYEHGQFRGIVELSLPIPFDMPHFVRD